MRGADSQRPNRHLSVGELVDYPVLRRYLRDLDRRGLTRGTIDCYRTKIAALCRHLHPASLLGATRDDIQEFLDTRRISPRTRYSYLSAYEVFYDWLIDEGELTTANPVGTIRRPKIRRAIPRPMPEDDFEVAYRQAPPHLRAWLALGAWQGLRCKEIAGLTRQDVLDTHDPPMLVVAQGKGGHERVVPLNPDVLIDLRPFLDITDTEYLFRRKDGWRRPGYEVSQRLCLYLRGLGIPATAHQLRHLFATRIYALTKDIRVTQELLGHQNPNTTAIYAAWSPVDATAAVVALTRPSGSGSRDSSEAFATHSRDEGLT
jgi:integrase/recombinase XerC